MARRGGERHGVIAPQLNERHTTEAAITKNQPLPLPISRRGFTRRSLLIGAAGVVGGYFGLRYTRDTIHQRFAGLGPECPWERVAYLSDLHLPRGNRAAAAMARQVSEWRPQVTLIGGDAIDHPSGLEHLEEILPQIRGSHATIATTGNWEYAAGFSLSDLAIWYGQRGVQSVGNARLEIGDLQVVCADDLRMGNPTWPRVLKDRPSLYLAHEPATWRFLAVTGGLASLAVHRPLALVSGHTHGGQIAAQGHPFILPRGADGYVSGWYEFPRRTPFLVSTGVGTSQVPVRVGSPAEWWALTRDPAQSILQQRPPIQTGDPKTS